MGSQASALRPEKRFQTLSRDGFWIAGRRRLRAKAPQILSALVSESKEKD
jgi:hypothetical protein